MKERGYDDRRSTIDDCQTCEGKSALRRRAFGSRAFQVLALVALMCGAFALPVRAQSQELVWERLDVEIAVQADGSALITESSTVNFTSGQFGRGFRIFDPDPDITISAASANDDAGATLRVERTGSEDDGLRLTYFFAAPVERQRRTYTLRYRVQGIVQVASRDNIALNWSAVFAERSGVPVKVSRIVVRLPGDAIVREATAYGVEARRTGAEEATVTFESTEPIPSGTSLTVDLIFASDVLLPNVVPTATPVATAPPLEADATDTAVETPEATERALEAAIAPTREPRMPEAVDRFRETRNQPGLLDRVPTQLWIAVAMLLGLVGLSTALRKTGLLTDTASEVDDADDDDEDDSGTWRRRKTNWSSRSSSRRSSSGRSSGASGSSRSSGKGSGGGGFG